MKISREEYLWQLSQQLYHIPAEEREAALEYYRNYFEEAGTENEEHVMSELGSPEELAKSIIADVMDDSRHDTVREPLAKKSQTAGTEEPGWEKYRRQMEREEREAFGGSYTNTCAAGSGGVSGKGGSTERAGKGTNIWMILFLLVTCPVWGGILIGLLGAAIGLVCGAFGLVIGLIAAVIGLLVSLLVGGVIGIVKALFTLITAPFAAGFGICLSIVMLAGGILLIRLFLSIAKHLIPGVFRMFGQIISGIVRGIGGIFRAIFGH